MNLPQDSQEQKDALHRKRLAQILRYVSSWHRQADAANDHSFVRPVSMNMAADFFQSHSNETDDPVLFSTENFRYLLTLLQQNNQEELFQNLPFSFYAATSRKRSFVGALKSLSPKSSPPPQQQQQDGAYWLRLTRLTRAQLITEPQPNHATVKTFLNDLMINTTNTRATTYQQLLSSPRRIDKLLVNVTARPVKQFLKRYKHYVIQKLFQKRLEPIYNRLFEWIQQQQNDSIHGKELVWSLGHAKLNSSDVHVNGPLLDVLVEVELARDGAILVKPRQHAGVSLNPQVVGGLTKSPDVLQKWNRRVAELEPTQLSPGQPSTYVTLLKQLAVELSPGGSFQSSSSTSSQNNTLVVSEAWCLYTRNKPSSVWARDANSLANQLVANSDNSVEMPLAAWSLTHGPTVLEEVVKNLYAGQNQTSFWKSLLNPFLSSQKEEEQEKRPLLFPLETSESQNRIANLLLDQNYPAVVTEGPPGTGKTHSIANIVCAYLCQGKRVLVTSKNASALSVVRERLPKTIRDLVVDVSTSESSGMRQLQETVERLADRVSVASVDVETDKTNLLKKSIQDLEEQLNEMNEQICNKSDEIRRSLQTPNGMKLSELSSKLIDSAPWLMQSLADMNMDEMKSIHDQLKHLLMENTATTRQVGNFERPPDPELISMVLAKSNSSSLNSITDASKQWISSLPIVGSMTGMEAKRKRLQEEMQQITINGNPPQTNQEWTSIAKALTLSRAIARFQEQVWNPRQQQSAYNESWPKRDFTDPQTCSEVLKLMEMAMEWKRLVSFVLGKNSNNAVSEQQDYRSSLDTQRCKLQRQIRSLAQDLCDAAVVAELSKSFDPDAQSALIRFAQIAGSSKFGKSVKASKMTQRQRRRRQEYLDAFDKCCRFIPCWILTNGQISDYLPAECNLFDLVVIDEASQSDVTVLPGMLRGKQWLIVGDGKQVSPTEAFVSEEELDSLRAALPQCPLESSLMPGKSFFDLCAQAFPRGRVVLSEHFRCAPDIIDFSNQQFYDGRLVPLRLPTKFERFTPALVDVKVNGSKVGKINEAEADKIVELVQEYMDADENPRSIGVISLIGDEQSRLIRGRLLDAVGPENMARHDVLIGDPPTFQGAERDIVFLSMVCSPGRVPTQSQQMHFQRANVAMSRARDRCVLVRSLDLTHIPSMEDMKVAIIEFFLQGNNEDEDSYDYAEGRMTNMTTRNGTQILQKILKQLGYAVTDMGVVWKNGLCVEHPNDADTRAALLVDCEETSLAEWKTSYNQQKAIERVGWKCLRVDALSLFVHYKSTMKSIVQFLASVGIEEPEIEDAAEMEAEEIEAEPQEDRAEEAPMVIEDAAMQEEHDFVTISSDEESVVQDSKPAARKRNVLDLEQDEDNINAAQFGEVVDLDFLCQQQQQQPQRLDDSIADDSEDDKSAMLENMETNDVGGSNNTVARLSRRKSSSDSQSSSDDLNVAKHPSRQQSSSGDDFSVKSGGSSSTKRKNKYRKLDKYSRDGRWYPKKRHGENDSDNEIICYDTDSDLPKSVKSEKPDDDEI